MLTTADHFIKYQIVARLSRDSNPVTLRYHRHPHINRAMVLLALHLEFPVYRAVRLATHLVESHPTHSLLPLIPSWRGPGRLLAAVNRSNPVPYSLTRNMDELSQAAPKVEHRALDLIVHPTLAKAACPSFMACTFVNVVPKSRRNLTPRMTSGKLKASRRCIPVSMSANQDPGCTSRKSSTAVLIVPTASRTRTKQNATRTPFI